MTWRWVALNGAVSLWLLNCQLGEAFVPFLHQSPVSSSSALFMGMNRKARRRQRAEKQGNARTKKRLQELIEETDEFKDNPPPVEHDQFVPGSDDAGVTVPSKPVPRETITGGATRGDEPVQPVDQQPEVFRIIKDEETGMDVIQQGSKVMDIVTRKAVKLSDLGPMYRLAQMFPGVPPDVREKYRFEYPKLTVIEMAEKLRQACSVKREDGTIGLPPEPSVASKGIDFVVANRDHLGYNMKTSLVCLTMRAFWKKDKEEGQAYADLGKHFYLLENHISAPFRQMMLDAEARVGPNFGNLDLTSYCGKELYERTADYLVLKGMVAHWTSKYRSAEDIEKLGNSEEDKVYQRWCADPKRFRKNSQVIWKFKDCEQILAMALKMCSAFVATPELFDDLPPEVRFLEKASTIKDGTALRQYMVDVFCPDEGIEPAGLREGMRRLFEQLDNMQIDPYADIRNLVDTLIEGMSKGTDDEMNESDPYYPYVMLDPEEDESSPAFFETYTFDVARESVIRLLDQQFVDQNEQMFEEVIPDTGAMADELGEGLGDMVNDIKEGVTGLLDLFAPAGEKFESYAEWAAKAGPVEKGLDKEFAQEEEWFEKAIKELEEKEKAGEIVEEAVVEEEEEEIPFYKVPEARALGRPHMLGWVEDMDAALVDKDRKIVPGRIINDDMMSESDSN